MDLQGGILSVRSRCNVFKKGEEADSRLCFSDSLIVMARLQVSVACAMLMVFDKSIAGLLCQRCPEDHYVTRNCSEVGYTGVGTKCLRCTNCLALSLDILSPCSQYFDTVCWNQTVIGDPEPTGVPPTVWILTATFVSMFLLASLALYYKLMFFKPKAKVLLSIESRITEMTDFNPPETKLQACAA